MVKKIHHASIIIHHSRTLDTIQKIWQCLDTVYDPEIPVLTVRDLGIVRAVQPTADGGMEVVITPTYSGCPAMHAIEWDIRAALASNGLADVGVRTILSPAWTTDWMSDSGKAKLKAYGIAPPQQGARIDKMLFEGDAQIPCPRCNSLHTELVSQFGSTACKALYRCLDCLEPFDYFKCH